MKPKTFKQKWREGMEAITPMQMVKINLMGGTLMVIGVLWGLTITFITHIWWLFIILLGSLFLTGTNYLSLLQKYFALKRIENLEKEVMGK